MRNIRFPLAVLTVLLMVYRGTACAEWDGSRTRPVHRIPLYDEKGEEISPHDKWAMPFSTRETCGECHDYETVSLGWHFNSRDPNVPAGRRGEPWVLVDEKTFTQLPVSNRDWEGAWRPEEIGMTPWRFTQTFGRHMPGGGWGEVEAEVPDIESRWSISGRLEINCLACHNASSEQDQSHWVIQIARENFRWAATAAAGLGVVDGMASRLPDTWDMIDGPDPDNPWALPPSVEYTPALFDAKNWVFLDLTLHPPADRCYSCHSTAMVGEEMEYHDSDVHLAAGLSCTDCHRNGLEHHIVRGNESGASGPQVATLSCEGCHYGEGSAEGSKAMGGRFGAPWPEHTGLSTSHIDEMSCTACHSGPWPQSETGLVRMSRANRLGVHGKAQWYTDLPLIVSPVYMKDEGGVIAPHHVFWPSFWARVQGETATPLLPEAVSEAAGDVLEPEKQVARVLAAMTPEDDPEAEPVYLAGGKMYQRLGPVGLAASDYPEAGVGAAWGLLRGERVGPVVLDTLAWTAEAILGAEETLPESQIAKALEELDYENAAQGDPVYIAGGKMYRWTDDGEMAVSAAPEAQAGAKPSWGDLTEGKVAVFEVEVVKQAVGEMLSTEQPLTEENVANVLQVLSDVCGPGCEAVYISAGKQYRWTPEGGLAASEPPPGAPTVEVFWGLAVEDEIVPLVPAYVTEAIAVTRLTEAQVTRVLAALAEDRGAGDEPAYVCGGKLYRLSGDALTAADHPAAQPYAWTFGHDVRPAAQSLGMNGCTDCHSEDAPFFFAKVVAESTAQIGQAAVIPMFELQGFDRGLLRGWEESVRLQPVTVYGGLVLAGLIAVALLRYGFIALEVILRAFVAKGGKRF